MIIDFYDSRNTCVPKNIADMSIARAKAFAMSFSKTPIGQYPKTVLHIDDETWIEYEHGIASSWNINAQP